MRASPVVLVVFNRPDLTRRSVEVLRTVRPPALFVVCDGPRPDHPVDAARVAQVQAAIEEIDWPCQVHTRYAEENLGVEGNVELGLDWVFSQVDRAIVLEDDCLPDPTFFQYAEELLERYRDQPAVWYVAGNGLRVPRELFGGADYAFSAWASVWGWATWADRWQRHRELFPRDHRPAPGDPAGDRPRRTRPVPVELPTLVTRSGRAHFAEAAASEDVVTHGWDKHWWLSIMSEQGLVATPATSMVQNVGFGIDDATHTGGSGGDGAVYGIATAVDFPLVHPPQVRLDTEVERELELVLARVGSRVARVARRLVRSSMLRRAIRSLISSRVAMWGARNLSRLTHRRHSR